MRYLIMILLCLNGLAVTAVNAQVGVNQRLANPKPAARLGSYVTLE